MDVRVLGPGDGPDAVGVINTAASWYAEFLSPDEFDGTEMDLDEWLSEGRRLIWYGAFSEGRLVGVMGLEYVSEVALLRHAYVLPAEQRSGVAHAIQSRIMADLRPVERLLVGTYAANHKARSVLEKGGFRLVEESEPELRRYWDIPEDRLRTSVVYELKMH
jgi:GNAT superfamily N-acetyltransferase